MQAIRFNLVTRIATDKGFFAGPIKAIHLAKVEGLPVYLTLIGAIHHQSLFERTERQIKELQVDDRVSFTKRSIPFQEFTEEKKQEYFLNFSVGDFVGYSSIEAVNRGMKTLFYNIGKDYNGGVLANAYCYCANEEALVEKFRLIQKDKADFDRNLTEENRSMQTQYILNTTEKQLLTSIL